MSRRQRPQCNGNTPVRGARSKTFREDLSSMGLDLRYAVTRPGAWGVGPKLAYIYQCCLCGYSHSAWKDVSRRTPGFGTAVRKKTPHKAGVRPGKLGSFNCSDATACRRRRRKAERVASAG